LAKRVDSWVVTDEFWERVEPLIPKRLAVDRIYVRKPGAGRPPKPARLVFEAIVYVLRTGCQWKALPKEQAVGLNPTDRGKKRQQAPPVGGRPWRSVVARRDWGQRP
jgi:transposase